MSTDKLQTVSLILSLTAQRQRECLFFLYAFVAMMSEKKHPNPHWTNCDDIFQKVISGRRLQFRVSLIQEVSSYTLASVPDILVRFGVVLCTPCAAHYTKLDYPRLLTLLSKDFKKY